MTSKKDVNKSPFVEYNGVYIRKVTALYILQENPQLSNDRSLRVRDAQPSHLFSGIEYVASESSRQDFVHSGDLCVFERIDSTKHLVGQMVQFSYLEGTKKSREYSSLFVDTTKESINSIGVLANYYIGVSKLSTDSIVSFKPLVGPYSIGYLPMSYYRYTIDANSLSECDGCSFSVRMSDIVAADSKWEENDCDFEDSI